MSDLGLLGDYEPKPSDWVREQVERIVSTGTTDGITIQDMPIVLLTYRGATSGKIRKTPVMRVEHDGRYAAVASLGGAPKNPQWYHSLVGGAVIELQDGTVNKEYQAREVSGDERAEWWTRAVPPSPRYAEYQQKTDRVIPIFVLEQVS
jgi:deazaflavin-dependent oxidoreductase (nitroreductase family)